VVAGLWNEYMQKKYQITEEEFDAIKSAIEETLNLEQYSFVGATDTNGRAISMSKETFFERLKGQFIIK